MKLDHLLKQHTRINSKWTKDLNVRLETIKIIEENIGSKISHIVHSNILLDISPQARETKEKKNQMGLYQTKTFCTAKEIINKIKRKPTEWENIFTDTSGKWLIPQIYKDLKKLNTKKPQITELKKWGRTWIQMANRHRRRCSMSLIIREMQIKTTIGISHL